MPSVITRNKKAGKKGVQLTLMVVGASGLGRTTFINALVNEPGWLTHMDTRNPEVAQDQPEVQVTTRTKELVEEGVLICLTVCDTPGFGDSIENNGACDIINQYIDRQYESILQQESRVKRNPHFSDGRVHAILYFITPTGHSLRQIDIESMRRLAPQVNVIPVIGKADSLTPSELKAFKRRIMEDIAKYEIPIYSFPTEPAHDDEDVIAENRELRDMLPFAIVASEDELEIDGQLTRARKLPWGTIMVDDPAHSDFAKLRNVLFCSHLTDLRDVTMDVLYENYRTKALELEIDNGSDVSDSPEAIAKKNLSIKENQLREEEEKLKEMEMRVQREIAQRRIEIQAKEQLLRNLESRIPSA